MRDTIRPEGLDLASLAKLIDETRGEGLRFEFKESLAGSDDRLAKCVAGFANAEGGYLVFGVKDPERNPSTSGIDLVVGVDDRSFTSDFANKIRQKVEPDPHFRVLGHRIFTSNHPGNAVRFVEVPKSHIGPHRLLQSGAFPVRRSGGDTLSMTTLEVRSAVINTLQIQGNLRMLRAYIASFVPVGSKVHREGRRALAHADSLSSDAAERVLIDVCVVLPESEDLFSKCFDVIQAAKRLNAGIANAGIPRENQSVTITNLAESAGGDIELWGSQALTTIDERLAELER